MLRSDEYNQHVHGGYAEETDPSLNVNDTDKEKSKYIIVHKPLSTNFITELKYDEHIEPSLGDKRSSYFNIFECGRNLWDQ